MLQRSQDRVICVFCVGKGGGGETSLPEKIKFNAAGGHGAKRAGRAVPPQMAAYRSKEQSLVLRLLSQQSFVFLVCLRLSARANQQLRLALLHDFPAQILQDTHQLLRIVFNRLGH